MIAALASVPLLVSAMTYAGLALNLAGVLSMFGPLRFLRISSRRSALSALAFGLVLVTTGRCGPGRRGARRAAASSMPSFLPWPRP